MSHRRALTLAATSLLALGLTACGDDAAKPEAESASTSAGPTTSAAPATTSAAAETTPAATPPASTAPAVAAPDPADYPGMDQQTEEGAKQTFRYFWDALAYGYQTGDTNPLSSASSPSCEYCSDARTDVESLNSNKEYWGPVQVESGPLAVTAATDTGYIISYGFTIPAHEEPTDVPGERKTEAEITHGAAGEVGWNGSKWEILSLDLT